MTSHITKTSGYVLAILMSACGAPESHLYTSPSNTLDSDVTLTLSQKGNSPWIGSKNIHSLPIEQTVRILFEVDNSNHTLLLSELGINLGGNAERMVEAWIVVSAPLDVVVRCTIHPNENTGLTLKFE